MLRMSHLDPDARLREHIRELGALLGQTMVRQEGQSLLDLVEEVRQLVRVDPQAAADALAAIPGVRVLNQAYVNEFTVILPRDARGVVRELADRGVLGGVSLGRLYPGADGLANGLLVCTSELTTDEDIAALASALSDVLEGASA